MDKKIQLKKGTDHIGIAVIFFCHDGKGNFVMAKRKNTCRDEHGRWDIGGGGVEIHDTVENTLVKEIKEEYCTDVLDYQFMGYRDVHREHLGTKTHWITLDFKVRIDPEKVKNGEPHKMEKIAWFRLSELPSEQELHSQIPHFLKKHKKYFQ